MRRATPVVGRGLTVSVKASAKVEAFSTEEKGAPDSTDYRIFFNAAGAMVNMAWMSLHLHAVLVLSLRGSRRVTRDPRSLC